jgi:hypothetical protein
MAGGPAKGRGVGVIPTIYPTNERSNCQDAQYGIRDDTEGKWGISRWKEDSFQPISKFLHFLLQE